MSDLVEEIAKVRRKLLALERELDELTAPYHPPDHCCPSCALRSDPRYWELSAKLDRVDKWLAVLIAKRDAKLTRDA